MKKVDAAFVREALGNDVPVIDARSNCAYIGWQVDGAVSRGHIPQATDFSADWLRYLQEAILSKREKERRTEMLKTRLTEKSFAPDSPLIIYDSNGEDAAIVASYLKANGLTELYYFDLNDWDGPLATCPRYDKLVPPEWVNALIDKRLPVNKVFSDIKIFECNWGRESITFMGSHIPGAIHIDTDEFEEAPAWTHVSTDKLHDFLSLNGIKKDTFTVLYSTGDQGAEYKTAILLAALGVEHVVVLNGGYTAWRMKGLPTERGVSVKPNSGTDITPAEMAVDQRLVNLQQAKQILSGERDGQLVDIREWLEYSGQVSGYDYIPKAGRIPGAVYGDSWLAYKNVDDTMRNLSEVQSIWQKCRIDPERPMAFFCGSAGWGAAMVEYFGNVSGISHLSVFEGGWCEWQLDESNPTDTEILEQRWFE